MPAPLVLDGDVKVRARERWVAPLLRQICGDAEYPVFVSDHATVYDVCTLSEEELVARLSAADGVLVRSSDLRIPLWQLVDELAARTSSTRG